MFFRPNSIVFNVNGQYCKERRRLNLFTTRVPIAYLPPKPNTPVKFDIVRVVQRESRATLGAAWWSFESEGIRDGLVVGSLVFDAEGFFKHFEKNVECVESQALYRSILNEGTIEITVEDRSIGKPDDQKLDPDEQDVPGQAPNDQIFHPITSLMIQLRYAPAPNMSSFG